MFHDGAWTKRLRVCPGRLDRGFYRHSRVGQVAGSVWFVSWYWSTNPFELAMAG